MKNQEVLSILITLVMGIFAGFYLYIVGFSPLFYFDTTPDQEEIAALTIVGEAYGGCQMSGTCPTFRVANDGSYRYLYTPGVGESQIVREGRLPFALQRELRQAVVPARLASQALPVVPATCNSYVDGIDVRYTVTLAGDTYELDSCGTAVVVSEYPWAALAKIWNHFETPE